MLNPHLRMIKPGLTPGLMVHLGADHKGETLSFTTEMTELCGGFHSHGGTPIARWFIILYWFIMENPI